MGNMLQKQGVPMNVIAPEFAPGVAWSRFSGDGRGGSCRKNQWDQCQLTTGYTAVPEHLPNPHQRCISHRHVPRA